MPPAVVKEPVLFGDVMEVLSRMTAHGGLRNGGRLATFDRRVVGLWPAGTAARGAVEVIDPS
jgi:hypothetical protein